MTLGCERRDVYTMQPVRSVRSYCRSGFVPCNMYVQVHLYKFHRSASILGRGWESRAPMAALSIPINHNLPFKWTGQELHFPAALLSTFYRSAEASVSTPRLGGLRFRFRSEVKVNEDRGGNTRIPETLKQPRVTTGSHSENQHIRLKYTNQEEGKWFHQKNQMKAPHVASKATG